jgi:hypothetical protein
MLKQAPAQQQTEQTISHTAGTCAVSLLHLAASSAICQMQGLFLQNSSKREQVFQ